MPLTRCATRSCMCGGDSPFDWRIMLLRPWTTALSDIARQNHLPPMSAGEDKVLASLTTQAAAALGDVKAIVGARRFFSGGKKREAGTGAADYLRSYREWALT